MSSDSPDRERPGASELSAGEREEYQTRRIVGLAFGVCTAMGLIVLIVEWVIPHLFSGNFHAIPSSSALFAIAGILGFGCLSVGSVWWSPGGRRSRALAGAGGFAVPRAVRESRLVAAVLARAATVDRVRFAGLTAVGGLLVLQVIAAFSRYGLHVVGSTPTYLAMLRTLAFHPLTSFDPIISVTNGTGAHATPDLQLLAYIWRKVSPLGDLIDPRAAYRLFALAGLLYTALLLHAFFLLARRHVSRRAAWLSLPVLLLVLGPADVISTGDFSLNGLMYAGYYSQTLATAIGLYTLVLLDGPARLWRLALGVCGVGLAMTISPLTGDLFMILCALQACRPERRATLAAAMTPVAIFGGFAAATAWPAYSIDRTSSIWQVSGWGVAGAAAGVAALASLVALGARRRAARLPVRRRRRRESATDGVSLAGWSPTSLLAVASASFTVEVIAWQISLFDGHTPANTSVKHPTLYWGAGVRWSLLYTIGGIGLVGMVRLWRRGQPLMALWFLPCFLWGTAGAVGAHLALWQPIMLLAQLPLACGVALMLAEMRAGATRRLIVATFVLSAGFRLVSLSALPTSISYLRGPLQEEYSLARFIPASTISGTVASDPNTSYYVTGSTAHPVLTLSRTGAASAAEVSSAEAGYQLLRQVEVGANWAQAAAEMWNIGVRFLIIDHAQSITNAPYDAFANGGAPLLQPGQQRRTLGTYFYRANRIADTIADQPPFLVQELDRAKLERLLGASYPLTPS
ncbi:MAG TPA: hypothetical protein VHX88_09730 [Solirubrobacteraceae bacterium]|jgi:hypothetical protein|nr:hypothetical protein [Solirubrobacteraceae bacterium]